MCKVWILDFGDFGFWFGDLLGFWGFWDFGFWRFFEFGGLGILDLTFWPNFWMLHKKRRLCTPTRVGGYCYSLAVMKLPGWRGIWRPWAWDAVPDAICDRLWGIGKKHTLHGLFRWVNINHTYQYKGVHKPPIISPCYQILDAACQYSPV